MHYTQRKEKVQMPNYIFNTLEIEGGFKNLDLFIDGRFDFNKIIPMPEALNIESGSRNDVGLYLLWEETRTNIKKGINTTQNAILRNQIELSYKALNPFNGNIQEAKPKFKWDEKEKEQILLLGKKSLENFIN